MVNSSFKVDMEKYNYVKLGWTIGDRLGSVSSDPTGIDGVEGVELDLIGSDGDRVDDEGFLNTERNDKGFMEMKECG
jgi:hypothetical protein